MNFSTLMNNSTPSSVVGEATIAISFDANAESFAHRLHAVSSGAALLFGAPCFAFILYCICARTPKYFRSYSRLVLISVLVDAASLLANYVCRPVSLDKRPQGARCRKFKLIISARPYFWQYYNHRDWRADFCPRLSSAHRCRLGAAV